jgi:APA family basic amino acid/polyamine antiporter
MNLFRRKEIADVAPPSSLKKVLGPIDLTLMGIGCIVGAGIFVLTGVAAATAAGPAIVLSFVLAGIACAFTALSYAELASTIGGAGSAYSYGYATLGEIVAWIIGWDLILEYGVGVCTVAVGWSGYVANALGAVGVHLPPALAAGPFQALPHHAGYGGFNVLAAGIILVLAVLLALGAKLSARFNAVMVVVKLLALALFIVLALPHFNIHLWQPFVPPRVDHRYGWQGVVEGASLIFFAYIGFDAVSTAVEETRNPQRDAPIGILASLIICTILYMVVAALLTGIVPYRTLDVASPVASALLRIGYHWGAAAVAVGAIAGLTTVMLVLYFGLSRILMSMGRDGLLPPVFGRVHPKTGTPVSVILGLGCIMAVVAGLTPIVDLAKLVNMGTLAAFTVVCIGVIWLRAKRPELERPFRTPFSPLFPALGALICFYLMLNLPALTWHAFFIWLGVGLCVYFLYSLGHSHLASERAASDPPSV